MKCEGSKTDRVKEMGRETGQRMREERESFGGMREDSDYLRHAAQICIAVSVPLEGTPVLAIRERGGTSFVGWEGRGGGR